MSLDVFYQIIFFSSKKMTAVAYSFRLRTLKVLKDVFKRQLLEKCMILTIGQRCADWIV
jgi:hypothetical protein